jgi:Protein of unknown function (DUF3572)
MLKASSKTPDYSIIVLNLIAFIVSSESHLERFQSLTGISIGELKLRAQDPNFHSFILDYAMQDEALILEFSASEQILPNILQIAHHALSGSHDDF